MPPGAGLRRRDGRRGPAAGQPAGGGRAVVRRGAGVGRPVCAGRAPAQRRGRAPLLPGRAARLHHAGRQPERGPGLPRDPGAGEQRAQERAVVGGEPSAVSGRAGRAAGRAGSPTPGRGGEPAQEPLPFDGQPRAADAVDPAGGAERDDAARGEQRPAPPARVVSAGSRAHPRHLAAAQRAGARCAGSLAQPGGPVAAGHRAGGSGERVAAHAADGRADGARQGAGLARRDCAAAAARQRRRHPAARGDAQPHLERGQVHRAGRDSRAHRGGGRHGDGLGQRYRPRRAARRTAGDLRRVPPVRAHGHARLRRPRRGPGRLSADHPTARRRDRRAFVRPGGGRLALLLHPAGAARGRRRRACGGRGLGREHGRAPGRARGRRRAAAQPPGAAGVRRRGAGRRRDR
ncbi:MAG: hypothetical protein BWY52_03325 [Chloroflexi bacterium ADurb.Bin325]|nr:MAG: hypothetical protein BWY52_03325 [Chloroflexi bacterium ADurb.Bin325]